MAEQDTQFEGIYAAYFTGVSGNSFALFLFKDRVISGADAGGGIYDGDFNFIENGKFIEGCIPLTQVCPRRRNPHSIFRFMHNAH